MTQSNPQTDSVELTPKRCRWCGGYYLSPKGARLPGCRRCCPTLEDGIADDTLGRIDADEGRHAYSFPHVDPQTSEIPF